MEWSVMQLKQLYDWVETYSFDQHGVFEYFYDYFNFREYISQICLVNMLSWFTAYSSVYVAKIIATAIVTSMLDYCHLK